jgi:hypothetical protein
MVEQCQCSREQANAFKSSLQQQRPTVGHGIDNRNCSVDVVALAA